MYLLKNFSGASARDRPLSKIWNTFARGMRLLTSIRRAQIGYEASVASLEESKLGIELSKAGLTQNQSVKRLTQLAFIFIPLSFLTSVFGMNIDVLAGDGARWWTVIIGGVIVYILVGLSYLGVLEIEKSQVWRISRKEQSQDRELESLAHP